MNVLILTPDRVGSTLLQRLLTIYMLRKEFDKPVINIHELSNGLIKYYNQTLNQEVLGKDSWGYHQSLPEVIELLKSTSHYKTSRLAHYHLVRREDPIGDRLNFYKYLNDNFYIISARRENLFEFGISWIIVDHSKTLNVYSTLEKVDAFANLGENSITATQEGLYRILNRYQKYVEWADTHFNIQSYFNYDTNIKNIEEYILNLDFMKGTKDNTWKDMFGQDFKTFNTCHKLLPDLLLRNGGNNLLKLDINGSTESQYLEVAGENWPSYNDFLDTDDSKLSTEVSAEIKRYGIIKPEAIDVRATDEEVKFVKENIKTYKMQIQEIEYTKKKHKVDTKLILPLKTF